MKEKRRKRLLRESRLASEPREHQNRKHRGPPCKGPPAARTRIKPRRRGGFPPQISVVRRDRGWCVCVAHWHTHVGLCAMGKFLCAVTPRASSFSTLPKFVVHTQQSAHTRRTRLTRRSASGLPFALRFLFRPSVWRRPARGARGAGLCSHSSHRLCAPAPFEPDMKKAYIDAMYVACELRGERRRRRRAIL